MLVVISPRIVVLLSWSHPRVVMPRHALENEHHLLRLYFRGEIILR